MICFSLNLYYLSTMGNLCVCVNDSSYDNQMTIDTSPSNKYRSSLTERNKHSTYFSYRKNFVESPIDEVVSSKRKLSTILLNNNNVIFREDVSSINTSILTTQNSITCSNDFHRNARLIVPILYVNTKITNKIIVNKKEIFISYDIIDNLNEDDIIYDCVLLQLIQDIPLSMYVKCTKNEIILYKEDNNSSMKIFDRVFYYNIKSVNKIHYKETKKVYVFEIITKDNRLKFGTEDEIVGKCCCKVISFLFNKQHY